jgi:hypothetical protein
MAFFAFFYSITHKTSQPLLISESCYWSQEEPTIYGLKVSIDCTTRIYWALRDVFFLKKLLPQKYTGSGIYFQPENVVVYQGFPLLREALNNKNTVFMVKTALNLWGQEPRRNRVVVPARQPMYPEPNF